MMEAGVVLGPRGEPLYWHAPQDRSVGYLPDSRDLWNVLWDNRESLWGFAHSHPGGGIPGPSHEDLTTFAAVESGLGKRLHWYIISEDAVVFVKWEDLPSGGTYVVFKDSGRKQHPWLDRLREISGYRSPVQTQMNQEER